MKTIAIIGGGASGIAAALSAKRTDPTARVILFEGLDRIGKKILATGNGRCNLGNADISSLHYHSHDLSQLNEFISRMPSQMTTDFFRSLDLMCVTGDMGRMYPYCHQATMVLDILVLSLKRADVEVRCSTKITNIKKANRQFLISTDNGNTFLADRVILSTGGQAAPKQGVTGMGYQLAKILGHSCTPLTPQLVPLQCGKMPKGLKGVRVTGALKLLNGKQIVGEEIGEVQLTDYGLSGIPTLQLSCLLESCHTPYLSFDFFPSLSESELTKAVYLQLQHHDSESLETALLGSIQKKVLFSLLKSAHIEPLSRRADSLTQNEIKRLVRIMKNWELPVTGPLSWEHAQVTGGGIPLSEIRQDFSSKCCPGLFLTGEILDVSGDCGGFNLHWAWCSGITAGTTAAET